MNFTHLPALFASSRTIVNNKLKQSIQSFAHHTKQQHHRHHQQQQQRHNNRTQNIDSDRHHDHPCGCGSDDSLNGGDDSTLSVLRLDIECAQQNLANLFDTELTASFLSHVST
jgi:ABC-type Zn2+ transport system substrate-binding protein/surface adhesin